MPYFILLSIIILLPITVQNMKLKNTQRQKLVLGVSFVLIFLLFALRNVSVGRDVVAYENGYEMTKHAKWNDFEYIYFEFGYILLMKICITIGMSFQAFLALISLLSLLPVFFFIKKFSQNYMFSIFIWVTYMLFEFYLTGLRQSLAMSIVLIGVVYLLSEKKHPLLKYLLFVGLASLFHKGALIACLLIFVVYLKKMWQVVAALLSGTVVLFLFRSQLFVWMKDFFGKDSFNTTAEIYIGANVIFLILLAVFMLIVFFLNGQNDSAHSEALAEGSRMSAKKKVDANFLLLSMYLMSIVFSLFFGLETSARSYMFFNQAIIVILPNCIEKMDARSKAICYILFGAFFVAFFVFETLIPNSFDIVPYKFFWE